MCLILKWSSKLSASVAAWMVFWVSMENRVALFLAHPVWSSFCAVASIRLMNVPSGDVCLPFCLSSGGRYVESHLHQSCSCVCCGPPVQKGRIYSQKNAPLLRNTAVLCSAFVSSLRDAIRNACPGKKSTAGKSKNREGSSSDNMHNLEPQQQLRLKQQQLFAQTAM